MTALFFSTFIFLFLLCLTTASYSISSEKSTEEEEKVPKETVIDEKPKVRNVNEFVAEKSEEEAADRYRKINSNIKRP